MKESNNTKQAEKERKRLSEADKIVIEWVAMTSDSYNERQAWQRAYAALRRSYKGGAKDSTIAEAASRFANQKVVKDYLEVCRRRRAVMERELRENIEKSIFSSDERIKEFIEKTGDSKLKSLYSDASERTMESTVNELYDLADSMSDPKDKANILMKIAEFGGLKQNTQENHREFYMPMICRNCNLYRIGERTLRAEAEKAEADVSDIPEGEATAQEKQ